MIKLFYLTLIFCLPAITHAQKTWTVCYQQKTKLKKVQENEEKNIFSISQASLGKKNGLSIQFNQHDTTNNITILVANKERTGLQSWPVKKDRITISSNELKKLFGSTDVLIFHYTAIPKDPEKAALVRMRPIHLFTVQLN